VDRFSLSSCCLSCSPAACPPFLLPVFQRERSPFLSSFVVLIPSTPAKLKEWETTHHMLQAGGRKQTWLNGERLVAVPIRLMVPRTVALTRKLIRYPPTCETCSTHTHRHTHTRARAQIHVPCGSTGLCLPASFNTEQHRQMFTDVFLQNIL